MSADSVLTPREVEVLVLVGRGLTSAEVATHLRIASSTVDTHVKSSLRKLGARNRRQAAAMVGRTG